MVRLAFAAAVLVAAAIAGCALFNEGPPDNTCRSDQDCFRAQGEVCNMETLRCEPGPDASVPPPPPPPADAAVDAAIDAAAD